jgi:hypothetical protein
MLKNRPDTVGVARGRTPPLSNTIFRAAPSDIPAATAARGVDIPSLREDQNNSITAASSRRPPTPAIATPLIDKVLQRPHDSAQANRPLERRT